MWIWCPLSLGHRPCKFQAKDEIKFPRHPIEVFGDLVATTGQHLLTLPPLVNQTAGATAGMQTHLMVENEKLRDQSLAHKASLLYDFWVGAFMVPRFLQNHFRWNASRDADLMASAKQPGRSCTRWKKIMGKQNKARGAVEQNGRWNTRHAQAMPFKASQKPTSHKMKNVPGRDVAVKAKPRHWNHVRLESTSLNDRVGNLAGTHEPMNIVRKVHHTLKSNRGIVLQEDAFVIIYGTFPGWTSNLFTMHLQITMPYALFLSCLHPF